MSLSPSASINLSNLRHNLQQVKQLAPNANVMATIKANGYGHGLLAVADALEKADGYAVAHVGEARELREHGIGKRILVMSGLVDAADMLYCSEQDIDLVIHSLETATQLARQALKKPINTWLKLDSGMHRLGLNNTDFNRAYELLASSPNVNEIVYMTHFSSSEEKSGEKTELQINAFQTAIHALPRQATSLANSGAILKGNPGNSDWVRPGIMLYGANPLDPSIYSDYPAELKPVMTLTAPVIAIRQIPAGDAVGYNGRWTANSDSRIATIGIGYGDGYPRHAENGTPVLINGQRFPLVGTVSMDMITVDISGNDTVQVGDSATLWGDGLPVEDIARSATTISYELLTSVSLRVKKTYRDQA